MDSLSMPWLCVGGKAQLQTIVLHFAHAPKCQINDASKLSCGVELGAMSLSA
jgi:hypothetical protein